jgi:signal transduction histidine kinase
MNLKVHLLLHIILAAVICLMATAAYVFYRADRQTKQELQITAEALGKQLEVQLFRITSGYERPGHFPDLELWKETHSAPGICVRFNSVDSNYTQGICRGTALPTKPWPSGFEKIYRLVFNPGFEISRRISYNGRDYGSISVASSVEMELARAWESIFALLELTVVTVIAVCLLVYIMISRALRPAQVIVSGLGKMRTGDLTVRLPKFEIIEWQQTGTAINELAANLKQLLSERKKLAIKLMALQEEERRYLAWELHDELGQCLAAINAVAASIKQTAEQDCPSLVPEVESIVRINRHIMESVRTLLIRLRPAEIDELGLEASLNSLVAEWNARTAGKIQYRLIIKGDCHDLPEPLPVTVFRIVQECLTNIAKHSTATEVHVLLEITAESAALIIEDNGKVDKLPFADNPGIGLLGIRERVSGLGGQLNLAIGESGGLILHVKLPLQTLSGVQHDD